MVLVAFTLKGQGVNEFQRPKDQVAHEVECDLLQGWDLLRVVDDAGSAWGQRAAVGRLAVGKDRKNPESLGDNKVQDTDQDKEEKES